MSAKRLVEQADEPTTALSDETCHLSRGNTKVSQMPWLGQLKEANCLGIRDASFDLVLRQAYIEALAMYRIKKSMLIRPARCFEILIQSFAYGCLGFNAWLYRRWSFVKYVICH